MIINKDTKLFISLSSKPSNFGTIIYNECFKRYNLNCIYKSFRSSNIKESIKAVRSLEIAGCSVSMPFKERVIDYLDEIDPIALKLNSVNTIQNVSGRLKGYNTDYYGAKKLISIMKLNQNNKILLIGMGAISRTVFNILKDNNFKNIYVTNRSKKNILKFKKLGNFEFINNKDINNFKFDVIFNATPIGMIPHKEKIPCSKFSILNSNKVADLINYPIETKLIKLSKKNKIKTFPGYFLSINQIREQFYIYSKKKIPLVIIENIFNKIHRNKFI